MLKQQRLYPPLESWDLIKMPASKELLRFVDPKRDEHLIVALLVLKDQHDLEFLLNARAMYWQAFTGRGAILTSKITNIRNSDDNKSDDNKDKDNNTVCNNVATLTIRYQDHDQGPWRIICETIFPCQSGSCFMLAITAPASESLNNSQQLSYKQLANRLAEIARSFSQLKDDQLQQRWSMARKRSAQLLSKLEGKTITGILQDTSFYRIRYKGKDVGFQHTTEQLTGTPEKYNPSNPYEPNELLDQRRAHDASDPCQPNTITFVTTAFIDDPQAAFQWAAMYGAALGPEISPEITKPTGAVLVRMKIILSNDLNSESMSFEFTGQANANEGYILDGNWQGQAITVKCRPRHTVKDIPQMTQSINVNKNIYLPWSLTALLGRIIPNKTTDHKANHEYAFLHYDNAALRYYSARLTHATAATAPHRPAEAAFYLITQMGTQGPITETWLDQQGIVLAARCANMLITKSSPEEIEKYWPTQFDY